MNRKHIFGEDVIFNYEPPQTNIDFLVIGLTDEWWSIYDSVMIERDFKLVYQNERYRVYQYHGDS